MTSRFTDSAGVPWEGRHFDANAFASDDGGADPELILLIAELKRAAERELADSQEESLSRAALAQARQNSARAVHERLAHARLLIPLLAELGEAELGAHGQTVEKSAELAIVNVQGPDGLTALPAFTSVSTMGQWNVTARPVPASAQRVALAALTEGTTRVVLDPGADSQLVLRRPALTSLAKSVEWLPPETDQRVQARLEELTREIPAITEFRLIAGDPAQQLDGAELEIALRLVSGLDAGQLQETVQRFANLWAAHHELGELVDSLSIRISG